MSDGKKKSLKDKLKSSPAAKMLKEEGPMKVAKTLGGYAKEGFGELADKVMDTVAPLDNTHMKTRQDHFNDQLQQKMTVRSEDLNHAQDMVHTYHKKGIDSRPFKKDNVSSIMNGFENRSKKLPPEGY